MAFIEKRPSPKDGKRSYRVRIRKDGAPAISKTFPTRKAADKWAKRIEAEIADGCFFAKELSREKKFSDFIVKYIEQELPKNQKSYAKQKMMLSWWNKHLGHYYLCHITPGMIGELRDKLMSETTYRGKLRTSSTTNRYLASLSKAFSTCQKEWHWIKENPALQIKRPQENKHRERYLEKHEIKMLLDACRQSKSPYLYPVTLFALNTGARKGEILGLKWEDLDFSKCAVTFKSTKNGDDRTLHLTKQIIECLVEERQKRTVFSEYVFPSYDGSKPACIRGAWEAVISQLGFKDVCFHTIRHSVASHLAQAGHSMLEIGKILGHRSTITLKYIHFSPSATANVLNRLSDEILAECTG